MLFVTPLSEPEQVTLQEMHQHHPMHWTRMRAHAILLSASGYRVQEIAAIYGVCRQTVSSWLKAWARQGVVGLLDQARSGRPRKLSAAEEAQVLAWLEAEPRSIKRVLAELEKRCGRQVSMKTVKRLCKRAGLVWKRVRQSLKDKRDPQAFAASVERLAELIEHEATERLLENPVDGTDARKRNIPIRSLKLVERTQEEDDDGYAALSCL